MTIRDAVLADVPQLVEMGQRFRATTGYAAIVVTNPEIMAKTATALIEQNHGTVLVAEGRGGGLVAMIGLLLFAHHLSGALTVGEIFWWSEVPAVGMLLYRRGRAWAVAQGATTMQMVQPVANERLAAVYARLGGTPIEVAWQFDLDAREAVA